VATSSEIAGSWSHDPFDAPLDVVDSWHQARRAEEDDAWAERGIIEHAEAIEEPIVDTSVPYDEWKDDQLLESLDNPSTPPSELELALNEVIEAIETGRLAAKTALDILFREDVS